MQPNTPSGTYTLEYKICENGANPTNCDNATATVLVENVIDAVVDVIPGVINGFTGGTTPSVLLNDTLDGVLSPVNVTLISVPVGPLTVSSDGIVTVAPNTPAGTYSIPYTICENGANPVNCSSTTVTVKVVAAAILAVDDFGGPVNGITGGIVPSVLLNDSLNGVLLDPSKASLTSTPNGPLVVNTNGTVSVSPNTPFGIYTVNYSICEKLDPSNCSSATVTVDVKSGLVSNPDINVGIVSLPIQGNVNTNDITPIGVTYGTPIASSVNPTTEVPVLQPNGSYIFEVDTPGIYVFDVPVCLLGQLAPCPTEPLTITVLDETIINPPVANPHTAIAKEGIPVLIPVQSGNWPGNLGGILDNPINITNVMVGSTATVTTEWANFIYTSSRICRC